MKKISKTSKKDSRVSSRIFLTVLCITFILAALSAGCSRKEAFSSAKVIFCPPESCSKALAETIAHANKSVDCALYEITNEEVAGAIKQAKKASAETRVIVDNRNYKKSAVMEMTSSKASHSVRNSLMHNKFCIIDNEIVTTGSYNPTNSRSINELIIINDSLLAKYYTDEFNEMWNGAYSGGKRNPKSFGIARAYFCPEDNCRDAILREIAKSKESIEFMSFVLTDDMIALALLQSRDRGVKVQGIVDNSQADSSAVRMLNEGAVKTTVYDGKAIMHHKVFVFDNKVVATGSYNPTNSGTGRNDENLLIIESPELASQYSQRFEELAIER